MSRRFSPALVYVPLAKLSAAAAAAAAVGERTLGQGTWAACRWSAETSLAGSRVRVEGKEPLKERRKEKD